MDQPLVIQISWTILLVERVPEQKTSLVGPQKKKEMQQTSLKLWGFSAPAINCAIACIVFGPTESTFLQNALYLTDIPEYIPILLFHFQLDYTRLSIRCDLGLSLPAPILVWDSI